MSAKLQVALDDVTLDGAVELLDKVQDYIDIAEVGTPLLMEYGMMAVRELRKRFPCVEVLCDGKIMDAGGYEARLAFEAGASYVTVLAVTDDRTVCDVVRTAKEYGGKVMADMICVPDSLARIRKLEKLGVDVIAVHTGVDQQAQGRTPLEDLKDMRACSRNLPLAVAGGINADTVDAYLAYAPEIVIAGGGIVHADFPAESAKRLAEHIRRYGAQGGRKG